MKQCKNCMFLDDDIGGGYCDYYEDYTNEVAPVDGDECDQYTYYNGEDNDNIFTD